MVENDHETKGLPWEVTRRESRAWDDRAEEGYVWKGRGKERKV